MKKNLFLLAILLCLSLAGASHADEEQMDYEVKDKGAGFEVRLYEPYVSASVQADGSFRGGMNSAFMRLARFIFGANTEDQKIAMTSPVEYRREASGTQMLFMMPSRYSIEDLPHPEDDGITFRQEPGRLMAAIQFAGVMDEELWQQKCEELMTALAKSPYEVISEPVYFGYDPPYVPPGKRRNEVLVEVKEKT